MHTRKILCGRCKYVILGLIICFIPFACRDVSTSKDVQDPSPIAFANSGDDNSLNIFLADEEGDIVKQLTFGEDRNFFPAWSPDGKSIAYTSDRGSKKSLIGIELKDWALVDLTEEMIADPDFHKQEIRPMERGESQVWIMDPDGNRRMKVSNAPDSTTSDEPSWKPDGNKILYSTVRQDDINGMKSGIWMVNPNGTDNVTFVKNAIVGSNRASWRSVYSPH